MLRTFDPGMLCHLCIRVPPSMTAVDRPPADSGNRVAGQCRRGGACGAHDKFVGRQCLGTSALYDSFDQGVCQWLFSDAGKTVMFPARETPRRRFAMRETWNTVPARRPYGRVNGMSSIPSPATVSQPFLRLHVENHFDRIVQEFLFYGHPLWFATDKENVVAATGRCIRPVVIPRPGCRRFQASRISQVFRSGRHVDHPA